MTKLLHLGRGFVNGILEVQQQVFPTFLYGEADYPAEGPDGNDR